MEDTARYNTAIHEAGHAVIGTLVGLTVTHLTVEPSEGYAGAATFDQVYSDAAWQIVNHPDFMPDTVLEDILPPDYHPDIEKARRECAADSMTNLAGAAAVEKLTGVWDDEAAGEDMEKSGMMLRAFFGEFCGDDEWEAFQVAADYWPGPTVVEFLNDPLVWSWIESVAQTAYYGGDMTGTEIRALRPDDLTYY